MKSPRPILKVLKDFAICGVGVGWRRLAGRRASPRWSFAYELGVDYLRGGFAHLGTLEPAEYRRQMETMLLPDPAERAVQISRTTIGGRSVEVSCPKEHAPLRTILYLHGGSYHYGSPRTHRPICARLAQLARAEVIAVDYRLAPEHPFPAGLEDAIEVYSELISSGRARPGSLVIAGDSAGGGLAGALLLALRERGIDKPAGAAMICPWVNLAAEGGSMVRNAKIDWLNSADIEELARGYAGDALEDPLVSPTFGIAQGDPTQLPPIFVQVGSWEVLADQAVDFAQRGKAAGVDVTLRVWEDMVHDWHFFASVDRSGRAALEEVAAFAVRVTT